MSVVRLCTSAVVLLFVGVQVSSAAHKPYDFGKTGAWFRDEIFKEFNGDNIVQTLRKLTAKLHVAGTENNRLVASTIADLWKSYGLQDVHMPEYHVLLSYPNYKKPNTIELLDVNGRRLFKSDGVSKPLVVEQQSDEGAGVRWVAYTGFGTVTGPLVYCNYGTVEDFDYLQQQGVQVNGSIALIRFGKIFRGAKAAEAQKRGALGAIIYSDPADSAKDGTAPSQVYPNKVWMPPTGTQRGTMLTMSEGDPLTPFFPGKNYTYGARTVEEAQDENRFPKIPVLPSSYEDAYPLLCNGLSSTPEAPSHWQGGLNCTYRLGGVVKDGKTAKISVQGKLQKRKIQNVIGYIKGSIEPDSYVLLGNHYDAWAYGSVDPNSGTAVLAEIARVFMKVINDTKLRPVRTIVFCNWDAEEQGLMGSTEWLEEHLPILSKRAVAYVNVDMVPGNVTLAVESVPSLYQLVVDSAKAVPNANKEEIAQGRKTVFDSWNHYFPGKYSWLPNGTVPRINAPGGGSDQLNFQQYAGIPVINMWYQNKTVQTGLKFPLYHTLYETPYLNEELMFPGCDGSTYVAIGRVWAEIVRRLTAFGPLPINLRHYAQSLESDVERLQRDVDKSGEENELLCARQQTKMLKDATSRFVSAANTFHNRIETLEVEYGNGVAMTFESANERLKQAERCFIVANSVSSLPKARHVVYSVSERNSYAGKNFPGIYGKLHHFKTAKSEEARTKATRKVCEQISAVQYSVECVINLLRDTL